MLNTIIIICQKELTRVFTDKRLVLNIFILPFISIIAIYAFMGFMIQSNNQDEASQTMTFGVIHPPTNFLDFSTDATTLKEINADESMIKTALTEGTYDYIIAFDDNFLSALKNYTIQDAPIITGYLYDKHDYADQATLRVNELINAYKSKVLAERFTSKASYEPFYFNTETIALDDGKSAVGELISLIVPMMLTTFIFAGAMSVGLDSFAGEKERGTMATLLMTPIKRRAIIMGKMMSLAVISIISTASSLLAILIALPFMGQAIGGEQADTLTGFSMTLADVGMLALSLLGMVTVFVALITITSLFAKDIKEAGTYTSPLYMIVILMGYSAMMSGAKPSAIQLYTPVLSNVTNMQMIFKGDSNLPMTLYAFFTSMLLGFILTTFADKLMHKERIIFPE